MIIRILVFVLLLSTISTSYAQEPSNTNLNKLIETIYTDQYFDIAFIQSDSQKMVDFILLAKKIPNTEKNREKISHALKKYYLSKEFRNKFKQTIASIYQKNLTDIEIQALTTFYQSEIALSILDNREFMKRMETLLNSLLTIEENPSNSFDQKLEKTIQDIFNDQLENPSN